MPPYPIRRAPPCDPVQGLANLVMSPYFNFKHPSPFRWDIQRFSFLTALADHPSIPLLLLLQLPISLLGSFSLHIAFSSTPVSLYLWSLQGSLQLHHLLLHNAQAAVSYSSWFGSTAWSQLGEVIKPLTLPWALGRHSVPTVGCSTSLGYCPAYEPSLRSPGANQLYRNIFSNSKKVKSVWEFGKNVFSWISFCAPLLPKADAFCFNHFILL